MAPKKGQLGLLHIKRNTEGTSNELSLSVLDAKKNQVDTKDGGTSADGLGKIPLFTLGGKKKSSSVPTSDTAGGIVEAASNATAAKKGIAADAAPADAKKSAKAKRAASRSHRAASKSSTPHKTAASPSIIPASTYDPEAEIIRRKRRRRAVGAFNIVAVVVVVAVVGSFAVSYISRQNAAHRAGSDLLADTITMIEDSDTDIVAMDKALGSSLDTKVLGNMQTLLADLPQASSNLDRASNKAAEALTGATDDHQTELANRCIETIAARKDLIVQGSTLMKNDIAAKKAANALEEAWNDVLDGDTHARQAAKLVVDTTEANVRQSMTESQSARTAFQSAEESVRNAQSLYPDADTTLLLSYLDKRIAAQNSALASDDAILVQDKASAESNNADANTYDAQAAAIAQRLPDNPAQPVVDAYAAADSAARSAYADARDRASTADAYLRDYLGTTDK